MKMFILSAVLLFASHSAMALDLPNSAHVYACNHDLMIRLTIEQSVAKVDLRFPGVKGNVINITSTKMVEDDRLQYQILSQRETFNFAGFQYPKGGNYIADEGDTNEAGYTFSIDQTAAAGAEEITAAGVYWGDNRNPESTIYRCINVAN
jgi:hypothetical protein